VRAASGGWGNALDISVYMKPAATLEQARQAEKRIAQRRDVEDVTLIEADDALAEFRKDSGFGEALDALKDNPLPHALVCAPRPSSANRHGGDPERRVAQGRGRGPRATGHRLVSRFNAILDVVRRVVLLAAGLFALGILVIVGNTIRLDIENRRDEIEVTKLVGAATASCAGHSSTTASGTASAAASCVAHGHGRDLAARRAGPAYRRPVRQQLPAARAGVEGSVVLLAAAWCSLARLVHRGHPGNPRHRAKVRARSPAPGARTIVAPEASRPRHYHLSECLIRLLLPVRAA